MSEGTIIVGYDGSPPSRKALDRAKEMALRYGAALHLIHVIDWSPFEFQTHDELEAQNKERRDQLRADREELFPPLLEELSAAGIEGSAEVSWGHPAKVMTDRAGEVGALFIVIGRVGESRLKSLLFGSVASRTVQLAECAVVVVP